MARVTPPIDYFGYRFHALFWRDFDKKDPLPVMRGKGEGSEVAGFTRIRHTADGLEIWATHQVDEPLLVTKLEGACLTEIIMLQREESEPARIITLELQCMPEALVVDLDAMSSGLRDGGAALDGVRFPSPKVIGVEHRVVNWAGIG